MKRPRRIPGWMRSRRFWVAVHLTLGLTSSIGLGWLALRGVDWRSVPGQLRGISWTYLALSLLLMLFSLFERAWRWQLLFVGHKVKIRDLFVVQNVGTGVNNLSPVRLFSEAIQFALLTLRYRVPRGVTLASLGVERVLDLVVSSGVLLVSLAFLPAFGSVMLYFILGGILTTIAVTATVGLGWASRFPFVTRLPLIGGASIAVASLQRSPGRLSSAFVLSAVYWLLVAGSAWMLALGLDLPVNMGVVAVAVIGTLYVATFLPSLPGAAGTFEFGIVYLLSLFGVGRDQAFAYGVAVHAVLFIPPTVLGVAFLPREWWALQRIRGAVLSSEDEPVGAQAPSEQAPSSDKEQP